MPYSFVIECFKNSSYEINHTHLHACFLQMVNNVSPQLAQTLHDDPQNKAFTLCILEEAENKLLWRLTLLDDLLFKPFTDIFTQTMTMDLRIGANKINIASVNCSPLSGYKLANFAFYSQMVEAVGNSKTLGFEILTPLAFKSGDWDLPLPIPKLFFKSLHNRWQTYSAVKFNFDDLDNFLEKHIFISRFQLESKEFSNGKAISIGAVGSMKFIIKGKVPSDFIKYINILSDYSFYAGVGKKTTMGMGQVRRI